MTDVVFFTPIVVKENEDREIHFLVQKEKEYLKLTVTSQDYEEDGTPKDSWTIHTQVKFAPLSHPNHTTQSDMFFYATVAEMANYIDSKRGIPA
ncbi:hypothetical protein [Brevibacillus laterosporus]|uniref:Uncharacterized protein n=1 Tax=Brevibacillus laterosporus TaxID=1465 RepID=A0AAP3DGV0_BRELA|nr:hypothetical protein [Brevibacillus laterosporus]MCR8979705.1 hypothetical protein [Brevibacillus laterosporus]MCZ0806860.1 hypothetical protein [Brevibacillus laterosporus]MCZ0825135.1 hypothetical protein [Brevibacillus laterosporus]